MAFVSGARTTFDDQTDHVLDLSNGIKFLYSAKLDTALARKIGLHGFIAKSYKHQWTETELAPRSETITLADGSATTLTVADSGIYAINTLLKCENEVMRVTARASATTLTVVRGYAGTTGAAHSSKAVESIGNADPENATVQSAISDIATGLYNYVQTLTRPVELSNDEIAQLSTEDGNPMNAQVERRMIELTRELTKAVLYGVRSEDATNKIHTMGGLTQFVTTNVTNVGGALTLAAIDAAILAQVNAGSEPDMIALSPYQYQKLTALDANFQHLTKGETTAGNLAVNKYQSGLLGSDLDIVIDRAIHTTELWIGDSKKFHIGTLNNNGVVGNFHIEDATTPGQDGMKKVIRGKYTTKLENQKSWGYLYGLS